jgi:hypothetical protein
MTINKDAEPKTADEVDEVTPADRARSEAEGDKLDDMLPSGDGSVGGRTNAGSSVTDSGGMERIPPETSR